MERRRKPRRPPLPLPLPFLQTIQGLLPPVIVFTRWSVLLIFFSVYVEGIMTFPEDSGVYSLFPDEDLKTGRKRFRFEDDPQRGQLREGREYSHLVRSYPMLPHDRLHRPVDYSGDRDRGGGSREYDNFRVRDRDRDRERERHGRVYFDENFRTNRFDYHRLTPRPHRDRDHRDRDRDRHVSPIVFETSRRPPPYRNHYPFSPPPVVGQSKLPPGAVTRLSSEDDIPTRIHIFDPESNSFGNPRNAGGSDATADPPNSSSERAKGPPSNFVETGPPGPESFLNHEEFLEYQKKIAFSRFQDQEENNGGNSGGNGGSGKKVLFESKEPFEIDGLAPPDKSSESQSQSQSQGQNSSGRIKASPSPSSNNGHSGHSGVGAFKPIAIHGQIPTQHFIQQQNHEHEHDQRQQHQSQRPREGHNQNQNQKPRGNGNHRNNQHFSAVDENINSGGATNEDSGGGGEVVESENWKSEVTQLPPTHITKLSKKFTPSIKHDEDVGRGTGFKLPMPNPNSNNHNHNQRHRQQHHQQSYSSADEEVEEPPNLHGFVPVVPFHLIGAEPSRSSGSGLERQRQQQQQRIVPVHGPILVPPPSTSTRRPVTTTKRPSPPRTTPTPTPTPPPTHRPRTALTHRPKAFVQNQEQYSGFRPAEVSKSSSTSSIGISDENISLNNSGDRSDSFSPASPILHASAGTRPNSETHSKVAITKQQELKRLQKQKQLVIIPANSNSNNNNSPNTLTRGVLQAIGLFPEFINPSRGNGGGGEESLSSSSSSSSGEPLNRGTGTGIAKAIMNHSNNHENEIFDKIPIDTANTSTSTASPHEHSDTQTKDISTSQPQPPPPDQNHQNETSSVGSGSFSEHELSSSLKNDDDDTSQNNEIFDTRTNTKTILTANGIRQGEFHLEGYMLNKEDNHSYNGFKGDGDGVEEFSRSSSSSSSPHNHPNPHPNLHGPPLPYDYPEDSYEARNKNPLSSRILLPGNENENDEEDHVKLTPRNNNNDDLDYITPPLSTTTTPENNHNNGTDANNDNHLLLLHHLHAGHGLYSSDGEPKSSAQPKPQPEINPVILDENDFDIGPDSSATPPSETEKRRTRFTPPKDDNHDYGYVTPTSTLSFDEDEPAHEDENEIISDDDPPNDNIPYYPYYKHFGHKINASISSSSSSRSGSRSSGDTRPNGKSELDPDFQIDGDGVDLERENRLSDAYRHLGRIETDQDSVDIPLGITLNLKEGVGGNGNVGGDLDLDLGGRRSSSHGIGENDDFEDDSPLFLESSETLINKTYYLDGNNSIDNNTGSKNKNDIPFKSMNFIKVTRIKAPSGPASKETSEKTSSTILARRTSKPAVIVSTTAAGARPRIVGSVVEAGPAWPGLVSNFIRSNNPPPLEGDGGGRSFTATVRPRGNSGNNPTHPATVIARQIQSVPQTEFRLPTVRNIANSFNPNVSINTPPTSPNPNANAKLIKQVIVPSIKSSHVGNNNRNENDNYSNNSNNRTIFAIPNNNHNSSSTKRHYVSSEESSSSSSSLLSSHIISNSSTGVVSMVHAHISHCPKLHSPTEVICDVHIREGHGIPNPQLTVGWRRKFYNSTQPDVLLALNKAPASGENGHFDPHHSILEVEPGRQGSGSVGERLEEFHDKFNVTLAPGISPMLRSVLLIRSVTAPDCGTYQCEVNDGINVLKSETLLFLCH